MLACKLLKLNPVMCEVVFRERAGAENVIATYHNNWVSFWCFVCFCAGVFGGGKGNACVWRDRNIMIAEWGSVLVDKKSIQNGGF